MITDILICIALFWIGGIFYAMRKGLNEIITGLSSIDERLARLERQMGAADAAEQQEPTP